MPAEMEPYLGGIKLKEVFDKSELAEMQEAFKAVQSHRLTKEEFMEHLFRITDIELETKDATEIFNKMDTQCQGTICWDEFVSQILVEFQHEDTAGKKQELTLPLEAYPLVSASHHRHPILRITYYPALTQDREISYLHGKYLTVSHDGVINYWSIDAEYERTVQSTSPFLHVSPTWITDMVCLPDVSVVCTSSSERDLRFYDATTGKFNLRVIITSFDHTPITMAYHFPQEAKEYSKLVVGDAGGNLKILLFQTIAKGPFCDIMGMRYNQYQVKQIRQGEVPVFKLIEIDDIHTDWVHQVAYYSSLNAFLSCALCSENSLALSDSVGTKTIYSYNVPKGISCFYIAEETHTIVTGGPDCVVRVWNTFVPKKASVVFQGHHAPICSVIVQNSGEKVYSLSKDKCIKVWDVPNQVCIQTYIQLPADLGERTPMCTYYNPQTHNWFICSMKLSVVICSRLIDKEATDGFTHSMPLTKVLYNPLFKCIVTLGLDSHIVLWDPWSGRQLLMIKNAHTTIAYGEVISVEITAGTFDERYQNLLTGARNGTIKMWNFNTGICIRNMSIEKDCEVTSLTWVKGRILAVGWNRHVIEFADSGKDTSGKNWEIRHTDDVLATAHRVPQTIVTGSYNGELIFWMLETGQPYAFYNVTKPKVRLAINIKRSKVVPRKILDTISRTKSRPTRIKRTTFAPLPPKAEKADEGTAKMKARKVSVVELPIKGAVRPFSVHAMCFLHTRPMQPDVGTLLVALDNGRIQVWSHSSNGGYLGEFLSIHTAGDYVKTMFTDPENNYLFTGTTAGYIKIWLMKNYMLPWNVKVCMPLLRLQFPFLWKDRVVGRAKRSLRDQPNPLLLSSYKAHLKPINHIEFIADCKLILTCSSDHTARIWTLAGRYIGTLGTFQPWTNIRPDMEPVDLDFRLPPDVKKIGSSTTMKVLKGGAVLRTTLARPEVSEKVQIFPKSVLMKATFGKRLSSPILGRCFTFPKRILLPAQLPQVDTSVPYIAVYGHLHTAGVKEQKEVENPRFLKH